MKLSHRVALGVVVFLLLVLLLAAVQNAAVVELRFMGWTAEMGLVQLVLLSLVVGALAGALATLTVLARRRPRE